MISRLLCDLLLYKIGSLNEDVITKLGVETVMLCV